MIFDFRFSIFDWRSEHGAQPGGVQLLEIENPKSKIQN